jgi:hypothetical protein
MLHLQSPLYIHFKAPSKETPLRVPHRSLYLEKYVPSPDPFLHIFQFSPKRSPLHIPLSEPNRNKHSSHRTILYPSLNVPGERASSPGSPSESLWIEMLITRAFNKNLSKLPVKECSAKFLIGAKGKDMPIIRAFYMCQLESPVKDAPSKFPLQTPPSPESSLHTFQIPQERSLPP